MDRQAPLIVITGPTASGKTDIVLELARSFPLEVVSADSMQVYRHMDIATAKPSPGELAALPHHLIDLVEPDEEFNAGMFVSHASRAIAEIRSRHAIPVVVGGTGLYIKALIYGLAPVPSRSEPLRRVLKQLGKDRGTPFLWGMLHRLDPETALGLGVNDRMRIVRGLEIVFLTGRRPSESLKQHGFARPRIEARTVCLMPDRSELYERIDARVEQMVEQGLVEETRRLIALGFHPSLRSMQTLAYRHIVDYLDSKIGLDEAISLIQRDTRRYAKRQITWMRSHYGPEDFHSPAEARSLLEHQLGTSYRAIRNG